MTEHIVSVDAGNGSVTGVLALAKGGHRTHTFPSVRAGVTGGTLGLGPEWEQEYKTVDWYGQKYTYGDDVTHVTSRSVERHIGSNRSGNEFHQFMVAVALANLGIKEGDVDLTLFCPPGMFADLRPVIVERFMENGGQVEIQLKGDKKPRRWRYTNISVWPEGLGAAACFIVDEKGKYISSNVFEGETIILDPGAYTFDVLRFDNGNISIEDLAHATWEHGGIHDHIRVPIMNLLKKKADEFSNLTVDDVDLVIRQGLRTGNYTLRKGGAEIDLKPLIDERRSRWAEWICNTIIDGYFDGFRTTKSVILVSGGDTLIRDKIEFFYPGKLLDPQKYPQTKKLHSVEFNAVGGLRLSLMRQISAQRT